MSDVIIQWPYLVVGVVLLWLPRQWLRTGKRLLKRKRNPDGAMERLAGVGARSPDDRSVQLGKEFKTARNWVDLVRALVGAYCVVTFGMVAAEAGKPGMERLWIGLILLVAVLIQALRFDRKLSFFAPIFFLLGMSIGSTAHYSSLFAFLLVLAISPVIPNARLFLTAHGLLLLPFGFLFSDNRTMLAINVGLLLLIPLVSLLTKRPVVISSRKGKRASTR